MASQDEIKLIGKITVASQDEICHSGEIPMTSQNEIRHTGEVPMAKQDEINPAGVVPVDSQDEIKYTGKVPMVSQDKIKQAGDVLMARQDEVKMTGEATIEGEEASQDEIRQTGEAAMEGEEGYRYVGEVVMSSQGEIMYIKDIRMGTEDEISRIGEVIMKSEDEIIRMEEMHMDVQDEIKPIRCSYCSRYRPDKTVTTYCEQCKMFTCSECAKAPEHTEHADKMKDWLTAFSGIRKSVRPRAKALCKEFLRIKNDILSRIERLGQLKREVQREGIHKINQISDEAERKIKDASDIQEYRTEIRKKAVRSMTKINDEVETIIEKIRYEHEHILFRQEYKIIDMHTNANLLCRTPGNQYQFELFEKAEAVLRGCQETLTEVADNTKGNIVFTASSDVEEVGTLVPQTFPCIHDYKITPSILLNLENPPPAAGVVETKFFMCSECHQALQAPWFKCGKCVHFQVCSTCENKMNGHPADHVFLKLNSSSAVVNKTPLIPEEYFSKRLNSHEEEGTFLPFGNTSGICFFCRTHLSGTFYRCGNCSHFLLCRRCDGQEIPDGEEHNGRHTFIKMTSHQNNLFHSGIPLLPNEIQTKN